MNIGSDPGICGVFITCQQEMRDSSAAVWHFRCWYPCLVFSPTVATVMMRRRRRRREKNAASSPDCTS
jgi:hypothetical protein